MGIFIEFKLDFLNRAKYLLIEIFLKNDVYTMQGEGGGVVSILVHVEVRLLVLRASLPALGLGRGQDVSGAADEA